MHPDPLAQAVRDLATEVQALRAELASMKEGQPDVVTVKEAQRLLYCSRGRVFELLGSGALKKARSAGKATLITRASISAYQLPEVPKAPKVAPSPPRKPAPFMTAEALRAQLTVKRA